CVHRPATSASHPLSLHDALPIYLGSDLWSVLFGRGARVTAFELGAWLIEITRPEQRSREAARAIDQMIQEEMIRLVSIESYDLRSEEHTSELQSRFDLVCRLLLE